MPIEAQTSDTETQAPIMRRAGARDAFSILQMMRALATQNGQRAGIGLDQLTCDMLGANRWLDVIVAEAPDGRLVGFAGLPRRHGAARGMDMHHFYVMPGDDSDAVGQALIRAVEAEADRRGAVFLRLVAPVERLLSRGQFRPAPGAEMAAAY